MIIFGVRNKIIRKKKEPSYLFDCNHCHSIKTVKAIKTFKYFHIFWIPIFPYSKKISTQCSHCKNLKYQNEINTNDLNRIKSKFDIKVPLKYYFGLIVIGFLLIVILFTVITKKININKNIQTPEIGDIYEIKYKKRTYTIYRIINVQKDSITFEINDYKVTSVTKLDDLLRDHEDDFTETLTISKSENIKNKQNIIDIIKNED